VPAGTAHGRTLSLQCCAQVADLESFKALMRYNAYQTDPVSEGDPTATM
jgi:hypothetical protein